MQHILNNELGLKPLKFQKITKAHRWTNKSWAGKVQGVTSLARKWPVTEFFFSVEKTIEIKQFVNKQNDRVYLPKRATENIHMRLATRTKAPPMVMVWAVVMADGRSLLVFIDRGVKINAEHYQDNVLKTV